MAEKKLDKMYMHVYTGSVDTKEGWIDSYYKEELELRGLTAEQAFKEDEGTIVFEVEVKETND